MKKVLCVVFGVMLLGGCGVTSPSIQATTPNALPTGGLAVLNWEDVTISLPLDAYGMSLEDKQIVSAAQAVLIWQCARKTDSLPSEAVNNARDWLAWKFDNPVWLYGFWNVSYVASHGIELPSTYGLLIGPGDMQGEVVVDCFSRSDYLAIRIVDRSHLSEDITADTDKLIDYALQAWDATIADPRYGDLRESLNTCVREQGYSVLSDSRLGGVSVDDSWSEEQRLQAFVAEATCNDQLSLTQQAGDIQASYEQEIIDSHEAELVAIKAVANERVLKATGILQSVGLL